MSAELQTDPDTLIQALGGPRDPVGVLTELAVNGLFHDALRQPASGWQEYLVRVAEDVRVAILDHTAAWSLIAIGPPYAPWLRAPLRSRQCVDTFLGNLHRFGFSDGTGVMVYRAFCSFLVGYASPELTGPSMNARSPDEGRTALDDLSGFPQLVVAQPELTADRAADEFGEALECLLERFTHDGPP